MAKAEVPYQPVEHLVFISAVITAKYSNYGDTQDYTQVINDSFSLQTQELIDIRNYLLGTIKHNHNGHIYTQDNMNNIKLDIFNVSILLPKYKHSYD